MYDELLRRAKRLVGNNDPEDLVQETYLRALTSEKRCLDRPWLHTILGNLWKNRLRDRKLQVDFTDIPVPPAMPNEFNELIKHVCPVYQETLRLYYQEGYTCEEISQMMGSSVGTTCSRLRKAKGQLHAKFVRGPIDTNSACAM